MQRKWFAATAWQRRWSVATVWIVGIANALVNAFLLPAPAAAAGTLTPVNAGYQSLQIADHHVEVVINNGFARTEVSQTFSNPNPTDVEAIYAFPLPLSAALSEMSITAGEESLHGEVVARERAQEIYQEQRDQGHDAALASKEGYQRFEFRVSRVPAAGEVFVTFVYYQPLEIDTAVGRYLYPLEEGGTDEAAEAFWTRTDQVSGAFSAHITLKSAWPVEEVRVPGFEPTAHVERRGDGVFRVEILSTDARLDSDLVFYYQLQDDLPGRLEVIPYREDEQEPGTFLMVLTPGVDLQPLKNGADYVFVLDVSGSMQGKFGTLVSGVSQALKALDEGDRFRIVIFSHAARELTAGWMEASADAIQQYTDQLSALGVDGGTNLYAGVDLALGLLDADRATSVMLATDAVTNQGVVDPPAFAELLKQYDIRVFGFLMGNSANWSLMQLICETSGGFYEQVSNADDIFGVIMLARDKVTHEALHDVSVNIDGVHTYDLTYVPTKAFRGQQIAFFGRYEEGGRATVTMDATITGKAKTYATEFSFPGLDGANPELERLWAMEQVERLEYLYATGQMDAGESRKAIQDIGVAYQIVTDETSMIVLSDEVFDEYGIDRDNLERMQKEHGAQELRMQQAPTDYRVDADDPMFDSNAPVYSGGGNGSDNGGSGFGGGATDAGDAALMVLALIALLCVGRRRCGNRADAC